MSEHTKSRLKTRFAVDMILLLNNSWQEFRVVVQTMRWEEFEKDIKEDGREAELIVEIEQIQELLDNLGIIK